MIRPILIGAALALVSHAALAVPAEELIAREISARYAADIPGGEIIVRLPVSVKREPEGIEAIAWNPATSRFEAVLTFEGRRVRMSGTARAEVEVPVLTRALREGEVISKEDLSTARVPATRSLDQLVTSGAGLAGKQALKAIPAGRVIQAESVGERSVIRRNDAVTVVYRKGGLTLTSQGRSLVEARVGEEVKVTRPGGGRPVVGVAMADGTVEVGK